MSFDPETGEFDFPGWDTDQVLQDLGEFIPEKNILHLPSQLKPYECDGLTTHRKMSRLVVLPETIRQCQEIMRYCRQHEIPVIARGAGTGITGGVLPDDLSIVVSLTKFNRIEKIDPLQRIAVVQPGVRNLAISEAAKPFGLQYAPDPSSQIACSIGGNVAENSGGVHCLKYGLTVNNVTGIKIIDSEGELIEIGGGNCMESPGFDLLALMHGSEGLLGIIVEITLKLIPVPPATQVVLAVFHSMVDGGKSVSDIISSGIIPAGLEMMDKVTIDAVESYMQAGYPKADALLLCELDGNQVDIRLQMEIVQQILKDNNAFDIRTSQNDEERELYWTARKSAFPAVASIQPDFYLLDGTVPRKALPEVLKKIAVLSKQYGLQVANVFHAGDGNLHPIIMYNIEIDGDYEKAVQLGSEILQHCISKGGSFTGEHGVGAEKIDQMCIQFSALELLQFHRIKAQLDVSGILNPGKAVPVLHRCAELGAMHVHNGEMPHADLPRF
ncbi:MAG: FAD-binding protein [Gammaproteobacteria bacterium]|nr:FAD-binding protein [Gammaproteobacteria bacterium]